MTTQQELRKQTEDLLEKIAIPTRYAQCFDDLLTKVYLTGYNNGIRYEKERMATLSTME